MGTPNQPKKSKRPPQSLPGEPESLPGLKGDSGTYEPKRRLTIGSSPERLKQEEFETEAALQAINSRRSRVNTNLEKFLWDTARQVEKLLNDEPVAVKRFQEQIEIFRHKLDAYYVWLSSQRDIAHKNRDLRDRHCFKPAKEGYIWDNIEGIWRKPDRKDIPNVTNWLPPDSYRFRAHGFSQEKRLRAKGFRRPDDKERLLCHYVLLAVIHDIMLRDPGYNRIYFDMSKEDIGLGIGMWAHDTLWDYVHRPPQNEEPQTKSLIIAAVDTVQKDLQEWCIEAAKKHTHKRHASTAKTKKAETKVGAAQRAQEWPKDVITLNVAVRDYVVSRPTLQRKIQAGDIKSHRKKEAAENSPHLIRKIDIEKFYNKRLK